MSSDTLYDLLLKLETVNRELLSQIKTDAKASLDNIIDKRDKIGYSLKQYMLSHKGSLQNMSEQAKAQSKVIMALDTELLKEIDLITHKLQSKQQKLHWALKRKQCR